MSGIRVCLLQQSSLRTPNFARYFLVPSLMYSYLYCLYICVLIVWFPWTLEWRSETSGDFTDFSLISHVITPGAFRNLPFACFLMVGLQVPLCHIHPTPRVFFHGVFFSKIPFLVVESNIQTHQKVHKHPGKSRQIQATHPFWGTSKTSFGEFQPNSIPHLLAQIKVRKPPSPAGGKKLGSCNSPGRKISEQLVGWIFCLDLCEVFPNGIWEWWVDFVGKNEQKNIKKHDMWQTAAAVPSLCHLE